jgi:hypothetical protein
MLHRRSSDEEIQPLLDSHRAIIEDYASIDEPDNSNLDDDDDDEPNRTKELKEKQKKRLQECGNWMAYLKDFKMLARLASPSGSRSAQTCLAILMLIIFADRALNILAPRQLGFITNKLASMHETGKNHPPPPN